MSTNVERSPRPPEAITLADGGDLEPSAAATCDSPDDATAHAATLAELPPGARLILRCRKDWRAASVSSIGDDCVRLNVASPAGHTYRVRRPHDSLLHFDGAIPVLDASARAASPEGERASWRVALARYDVRW